MIYYDFHIHSALSPCSNEDMTPNNIVNMAKLKGLDLIAVSDHNTVGNVQATMIAGEKAGVMVLPAMEVETSEEVHILTLYPNLDAAMEVAKLVADGLPKIKNRPEIFGEQILFDKDDHIIGYDDRFLITAASLSINKLFDAVSAVGGIFVPAHVDRHSYSILTNLGFMPEELNIDYIEVSKNVTDLSDYLSDREFLKKYNILRNSDAHSLENIAEKESFISENSTIFQLFKKNIEKQ